MNDELLDRLRQIASKVDAVPSHVELTAQAALSTRRLDEELAELVHDSLHAPELVRDEGDVRMLSFEAGDVSVELQLDGETIRGLVTGASGEVTIECRQGSSTTATVDDNGWFTTPRPNRTARIRLRADDGTVIVTSWFTG